LFSACEEFIDLQPLDKISTNDYWKTTNDLKGYVVHFYPRIMPPILGTGVPPGTWDDGTDNILREDVDDIMNGERVLATGNWRNEWTIIRDLNIFFENYGKCQENFNSYKHYVGEAYFFRAWSYFQLLKKYGDLPWYANVVELDSESDLMKPRDPRTLIADSIIADLDKATLYLDKKSVTGNNRVSKEAALAFKTRVALYEGTWQKYHAGTDFGTPGADPDKYFQACVDAATELMNGTYGVGIYNTGNPATDFYKLHGMDNMSAVPEVIFYRAFNSADGLINAVQYHTTKYPVGKSATWELVSSFLGTNGQPYDYLGVGATTKGNAFLTKIAADCDNRLKSTIWIPGDKMSTSLNLFFVKPGVDKGALELCATGFMIKKFSNPDSKGAGQTWEIGSETGQILIRYAEVLLNYAEAKYELDNSVATTQLNLLRQRAGMPNFTVNAQSSDLNPVDYGYTISDELYEIRRERRVELAYEGFRQSDFMRWAAHELFTGKRLKGYPFNATEFPAFNPTLDANGLIDYFAAQIPSGYGFRPDQDYLYSIPQDEITLNPALEQNPNW
jgi:hypothetical protein